MLPLSPRFAPSSRSHARLSIALLALLALASSCARKLPTAPSQAENYVQAFTGSYQDAGDLVVVMLGAGEDAHDVADDYGATVLASAAWGCARLAPPSGETPDQLAAAMRDDPRVVTAERDAWLEPAETRQESFAFDDGHGSPGTFVEQPAADCVGLGAAHVVSEGAGVRVAILDTGAELNHPALAGHIVGGYDFVGYDDSPSEQGDGRDNDGDGFTDEAVGHGTHVAGIVALTAPSAQLLIVRVLDGDGRGDMMTVAEGIQWAVEHGAQVINLSLGSLRSSEMVQYMLEQAEDRGVVVAASAGNRGAENPREYPAASSHALAVAASDAQDHPASFTSFGDFVAVSAPGVAVRSSFVGGGYRLWSGTSMSTPFMAGTAALLLSIHPGWNAGLVMKRIELTARPLVGVSEQQEGKLGVGALDAGAALAPDLHTGGDADSGDPNPPAIRR